MPLQLSSWTTLLINWPVQRAQHKSTPCSESSLDTGKYATQSWQANSRVLTHSWSLSLSLYSTHQHRCAPLHEYSGGVVIAPIVCKMTWIIKWFLPQGHEARAAVFTEVMKQICSSRAKEKLVQVCVGIGYAALIPLPVVFQHQGKTFLIVKGQILPATGYVISLSSNGKGLEKFIHDKNWVTVPGTQQSGCESEAQSGRCGSSPAVLLPHFCLFQLNWVFKFA